MIKARAAAVVPAGVAAGEGAAAAPTAERAMARLRATATE